MFGRVHDQANESLVFDQSCHDLHVDEAQLIVVGCSGVCLSDGKMELYAYTDRHSDIHKAMVSLANEQAPDGRLVVLCDGSKFHRGGQRSLFATNDDLPNGTLFLTETHHNVLAGRVVLRDGEKEVSALCSIN